MRQIDTQINNTYPSKSLMNLKPLFPSFNDPGLWRSPWKSHCSMCSNPKREKEVRQKVLERDHYACVYCCFECNKYQIVHHINDNPNDWNLHNLETICQMCHLILHVGRSAVIESVVDLYRCAQYSQNEIIQKTRHFRIQGKKDFEIIEELGLNEKVEFKQDPSFLKHLLGFVTSREPPEGTTNGGLKYQHFYYKTQYLEKMQREHTPFTMFNNRQKSEEKISLPHDPLFIIKPAEQAFIARIILQAVENERTGKHKLAAFLRGSKSQLVREPGLDKKQGYGALLWHDIPTIEGFIDQLEQMELIMIYRVQTGDYAYPVLQLSEAGRKVLDEKKSVPLIVQKNIKPITMGESERETLAFFHKGLKPEEIAAKRGLARSTIYGHLCTLITYGELSSKQCVADYVITKVLQTRKKLGQQAKLKEIKDMLPIEITYEEIRAVLADAKLNH